MKNRGGHINRSALPDFSRFLQDHVFVYAKKSGNPYQLDNFGQRSFMELKRRANVKDIRFHVTPTMQENGRSCKWTHYE